MPADAAVLVVPCTAACKERLWEQNVFSEAGSDQVALPTCVLFSQHLWVLLRIILQAGGLHMAAWLRYIGDIGMSPFSQTSARRRLCLTIDVAGFAFQYIQHTGIQPGYLSVFSSFRWLSEMMGWGRAEERWVQQSSSH